MDTTISRRSFVNAVLISGGSIIHPAHEAFISPDTRPRLKITGTEIIVVDVNELGTWDFVRLQTDAGVTGIGEASYPGRDLQKALALNEVFPLIEGKCPFDIEEFRKRFFDKDRHRADAAGAAFCAIEQAMWDICGKTLGVPVADLLGGRLNNSMRAYANINRATRGKDRTPAGFARNAVAALEKGYTAIKAAPFDYMPRPEPGRSLAEWRIIAREGIECIKAMREAIGSENALLIDVHNKFNREFGIEMARELAQFELYWYEEPVNPELFVEDLAAINKESPLPVAGGELIWGIDAFFNLLKADALDICMPDVKYCGGILELKKIAAIAEAAGATCAPHNPAGPVSTAASVQVCATMPNFLILEYAWGEVPWRDDLITPPEVFNNGHLSLSGKPGLGIEFNQKILQKHRVKL